MRHGFVQGWLECCLGYGYGYGEEVGMEKEGGGLVAGRV